jgi:hypothetical protein
MTLRLIARIVSDRIDRPAGDARGVRLARRASERAGLKDAPARVPSASERAFKRDQCLRKGRLQLQPEALRSFLYKVRARCMSGAYVPDVTSLPKRHIETPRKPLILPGYFRLSPTCHSTFVAKVVLHRRGAGQKSRSRASRRLSGKSRAKVVLGSVQRTHSAQYYALQQLGAA